jgi:hypothetical protein
MGEHETHFEPACNHQRETDLIKSTFGNSANLCRTGLLRSPYSFCAAAALLSTLACGSDSSDDGVANYYLSGRVLNGSTLEPVEGAELSLSVGQSTKIARSAEDGSFSVGPITPESDYRISADLEGFDDFAFYGSRLPRLDDETDHDRALVGDVLLYHSGDTTPQFTISAGSRDARMPLDPSSAEVRFLPVRIGTDPAASRPAVAAGADAGAPEATLGITQPVLPNHALEDMVSYRASIVDGEAVIPQGALRFGGGYNVEVYGGPQFEPESLTLSAARIADLSVWLSPSSDVASTDLSLATSQYFSGRIYDGVSLSRLTDYSIRLEYFDRAIPGSVDATGRYFVGPLLANADYSIVVEAEGYRSFLSHNERIADDADEPLSSLYYDAFLYPESVPTPGATCRVRVSDSTDLPSGFMRFAPRSSSSLLDEDAELPVGVTSTDSGRQLWSNDEDLQQRAVTLEIQNGEASLASGQLVYGVCYAVTIYGVDGHEVVNDTYVAGVDADRSWILDPLSDQALALTALSTDTLEPTPSGRLEMRFNQPIALDPGVNANTILRALNDAFSISSPDADTDTTMNVLVDAGDLTPPVAPGYRGVSLQIDGDRMILSWDSASALATSDADDPIESVTYGGLGSVMIYAASAQDPSSVALSSLLGSGSSSVQLVAQ